MLLPAPLTPPMWQPEKEDSNHDLQVEESDRNNKHVDCFENKLCVDLDN
jgi:hypothetical protein